jgi:hypothetical protein
MLLVEPSVNLPGRQIVHALKADWPSLSENWPPGQSVQVLSLSAPATMPYFPAAHRSQSCESPPAVAEYCPGGQFLQSKMVVLPVWSENLPGRQAVQTLPSAAPTESDHLPAEQAVQSASTVTPRALDHLPSVQSLQSLSWSWLAWSENLPTPHFLQ